MRERRWVLAGSAVFGILLAACGGSSGGGSGGSGSTHSASPATMGTVIKSDKTSAGMVLANAQGRTLYWFAIDTPAQSKCNGACATAWPPVTGHPQVTAGLALPGKIATIKRADGTLQVTYNGHPLYTYAGDSAPGQANGNGVNGFGGIWHAVILSGAAGGGSSSPQPSPSHSSGGGGYGY